MATLPSVLSKRNLDKLQTLSDKVLKVGNSLLRGEKKVRKVAGTVRYMTTGWLIPKRYTQHLDSILDWIDTGTQFTKDALTYIRGARDVIAAARKIITTKGANG